MAEGSLNYPRMAKLKLTVFAAVQLYFRSGYYPIWKYSVGMRKPGLLWAVRLSAHRAHAPIITLFMVTPYLVHRYRTGIRLPSVVYALNTIFSPVHPYFHPLDAIFFSTTRQLSDLPKVSRKYSESYRNFSFRTALENKEELPICPPSKELP